MYSIFPCLSGDGEREDDDLERFCFPGGLWMRKYEKVNGDARKNEMISKNINVAVLSTMDN